MKTIKTNKGIGTTRRGFLGGTAAAGAYAALGAPALAQEKTVHLGASLPLTGPYEKVSKIYRDAYDFWTKTSGGTMKVAGEDWKVDWTIYDDENNASRTAQLTEKLISDDSVDLIVGTYGTDTVLAQGAIARKHNKLTVQAGAASSRVDQEIGGHTTYTLVGYIKDYPALAMEYLATVEPKPTRVALVTMDDPVYREMAVGVKEKCEKHGMEVVFEDVLPMDTRDLRPTVLKMKNAGEIDAIYNTGWDVICIKLVEEMSALGVNPKAFVGGHLTTSPEVKATLQGKLKDVIGVTLWLPQLSYTDPFFESPAAFAAAFEAEYGYAPTYHAAMAYSVPIVYERALMNADPSDPFATDPLRAQLQSLEVETVWGPISFDEKGRISRGGAPVLQWLGDGPEPKVIFPEAIAEVA
ncbi:MAG: amino acid ABC transporter substrate-binding protein, partial [Roseovarius sp.]